MTTAIQPPSGRRMSPAMVRSATFNNRRRGLDPEEVNEFLHRVASDIASADADRAALRSEINRLEAEVSRLHSVRPKDAANDERVEISTHAVSLLSQAQQAADSAVAEAERYSRDLVMAARHQYQEILERAQEAANEAMRDLQAVESSNSVPGGYNVPVQEIEYVRTFAQIAQVQLRSVLDALAREVDRLGQVPQFEDAERVDRPRGPVGVPNPRSEY